MGDKLMISEIAKTQLNAAALEVFGTPVLAGGHFGQQRVQLGSAFAVGKELQHG